MDYLPLASITADRATRRHFDGGRVDSTAAAPLRGKRAATSPTFRGSAALRARVAGLLYRGARAVEPCGYRQVATR
ncbi:MULTISPECIES: hypothetical protein [unclassified Knoellia]|uniref:hypothetical protein n=1 Tax=Knoellia altitudinis TaxID=3404795 RepID=UPI00360E6E4C